MKLSALAIAAASQKRAQALGEVMQVLLASKKHDTMPLANLHTMVLPAISSGKFLLMYDNTHNNRPVAVAFYAHVSDAVDHRLSAQDDSPLMLASNEWQSGAHPWLIDVCVPEKLAKPLLKRLADTVFAGQTFKMPAKNESGQHFIKTMQGKPVEKTMVA